MKLSAKLLFIFLFIFQLLQAQKGFRMGPTSALFFSKPSQLDSIPNQYNFRYKTGFNAGASFFYGFTKKFGLTTNFLFTNKGYKIFNDSNKHGNTLKNNQSYLEIPIYLSFRQRFNSLSFLRECIGVSFSTLLSPKTNEVGNNNGSFRIKETTNNIGYTMLHLGIEVGNENKVGNVFIFAFNFNHSFSSHTNLAIYNNKNANTPYFNLGFKGSYIGASITYQFNLKNAKKSEEFFY